MTNWVRLWEDMPTDPKWRVISRRSGRPLPEVIAVFVFMMTNAGANATERGRLHGWDDEDVAAALDMGGEHVAAIRSAMEGKTIDGDRLTGWERRQPKREDNSAERSKAWREEQKRAKDMANATERTRTHANAPERPEKNRIDISSSLRSDDKRAERAPTPKEILTECLSDETATELIAHRRAMKAPLTAGSAKGLIKQFRDYGDPEAAARAMMARGWRGFNPDWMRQDTRAGPKASGGGWESLLTTNFGGDDEPRSEEKRACKAIPVLSFREAERRTASDDDGGGVSRNAVELLVGGSFRRM